MQCSAFEAVVDDLARAGALDIPTREAAIGHAQTCARCAALREAADSLSIELHQLAMTEQQHEAPPRVEAALVEAFRADQERARGVWPAPAWAWSLAAAALLALGLATLALWPSRRHESIPAIAVNPNRPSPAPSVTGRPVKAPQQTTTAEASPEPIAQAQQVEYFLPLPYSVPIPHGEDATVVRVRMARGALGSLGLPVNEERADEVIQVDFLVAEDGSPQAIRIP